MRLNHGDNVVSLALVDEPEDDGNEEQPAQKPTNAKTLKPVKKQSQKPPKKKA
jgi:hypothetical protein